jgi:hypothetical protein
MRPRDPVTLKLMPPPCRRYDPVPFYKVALPVLDADPRSPALPVRRKLELIQRAMNTVIDGDKPPIWVQRTDSSRPDNRFIQDMWAAAIQACRRVEREVR